MSRHNPNNLDPHPPISEIRESIASMQVRLEDGQGDVTSAMCRLSLRMSKELLRLHDAYQENEARVKREFRYHLKGALVHYRKGELDQAFYLYLAAFYIAHSISKKYREHTLQLCRKHIVNKAKSFEYVGHDGLIKKV